MSIVAVRYQYVVVLNIVAPSRGEYQKDLAKIRKTVDEADLEYNGINRTWVVKNPEKYIALPAIQKAINRKDLQMKFEGI